MTWLILLMLLTSPAGEGSPAGNAGWTSVEGAECGTDTECAEMYGEAP